MTLVMEGVSKSFEAPGGSVPVFENLNAVFKPNTSVAILGARRSGKSTLIQLLSGELSPDRGKISQSCRVSFRVSSARMFHFGMSIQQNISFIARAYQMNPKPVLDFVAEFAGLTDVMDLSLQDVPREKRTRLLFTLPYAMPFDIYLCDEAIVGGAGKFREKCEQLVEARRGTSGLVFATKSPRFVRKFADQAILLDGGTLHFFKSIDAALAAFSRVNKRQRSDEQRRFTQAENIPDKPDREDD